MNTITIHFELKNKVRTDGRCSIMIRISKGREQKRRISTGLVLFKKDFQATARFGCWVKSSDSQSFAKNQVLKDILTKFDTALFEIKRAGKIPTINNVIDFMEDNRHGNTSFTQYYEKVIEDIKASQHATLYRKYKVCFAKFKRYVSNRNIDFADIDSKFCIDYERHFLQEGNGINTIMKDLSIVRAIYNRAICNHVISEKNSPFKNDYKLHYEKTFREKLSENDLLKIQNLNLVPHTILWHTRNYFLMSYYTCGARWSELATWRMKDFYLSDKDDENRLNYKMHKTGSLQSIKICLPALMILKLYCENKKGDDFVFPILDDKAKTDNPFELFRKIDIANVKTNKALKTIAQLAGIKIKLTMHIARHTFADIARQRNANLYSISKALRHSKLSVTERYLAANDTKSVDSVIELIARQ